MGEAAQGGGPTKRRRRALMTPHDMANLAYTNFMNQVAEDLFCLIPLSEEPTAAEKEENQRLRGAILQKYKTPALIFCSRCVCARREHSSGTVTGERGHRAA